MACHDNKQENDGRFVQLAYDWQWTFKTIFIKHKLPYETEAETRPFGAVVSLLCEINKLNQHCNTVTEKSYVSYMRFQGATSTLMSYFVNNR